MVFICRKPGGWRVEITWLHSPQALYFPMINSAVTEKVNPDSGLLTLCSHLPQLYLGVYRLLHILLPCHL